MTRERKSDVRRARPLRLIGALLIVCLVASCGSSDEDSTASSGGSGDETLAVAVAAEPAGFNPFIETYDADFATQNVYEPLVRKGQDGELEPILASELPTQIDDLTWEIKLVEGVTFQNGEPFDADTAVHAFDLILNNEEIKTESSILPANWYTFAGVEKIDDFTIHVTTNVPDPIFSGRLERVAMVPPEHFGDGEGADEPVGTGPYTFASWERGRSVTLERWEDYRGDRPEFESVEFRFIPEGSSRTGALLADEVDLVLDLPLTDAGSVPKFEVADVNGIGLVTLDTSKPPTDDVQVRQAMSLALNREELIDILGEAGGTVPSQLLDEQWFGADESRDPLEYDPEEAQRLIEEAGASGETIVMTTTLEANYVGGRDLMEAIAANWEAVGLNVELQILSVEDMVGVWQGPPEQRSEALYIQASNDIGDADKTYTSYYESEESSWNDDEELKSLVAEARSELDEERRRELYKQATDIGMEQMYVVPVILVPAIANAMSERVTWEPPVGSRIFRLDQITVD